jgi:outer membrane receptor protein involved in Fe transport
MLTENVPNYRGAAAPYSLGYIPGPWMQSIQVSKGASSVKNGYESITGQINVEFKKPQATPFADANLYFNTKGKLEANLGANLHLSDRWSTALLGHYEILDKAHDENDDSFADMPKVRQGSLMSRWAWVSDNYIFQAAIKGLKEHREGGQVSSHHSSLTSENKYLPFTPAPKWSSELKWELSHHSHPTVAHHHTTDAAHRSLLNNLYVAAALDCYLKQSHIYSADDTETETPGYALLSLSAGTDIQLHGKKIAELYVTADNLLDKAYQNHLNRLKYADLNTVTGRRGVYNMGRNITFKVVVPIAF